MLVSVNLNFVASLDASTAGNMLDTAGLGFLSPYFPWYLSFGCIMLATLVGAVSGLFPALYASKQNAVDALRYE